MVTVRTAEEIKELFDIARDDYNALKERIAELEKEKKTTDEKLYDLFLKYKELKGQITLIIATYPVSEDAQTGTCSDEPPDQPAKKVRALTLTTGTGGLTVRFLILNDGNVEIFSGRDYVIVSSDHFNTIGNWFLAHAGKAESEASDDK